MDSPRGRIYLMKAGVEGRADLTPSLVTHMDNCLGCMACVTACPSGVQYGPLIERTRARIEQRYPRPAGDAAFRALLMALVPYPARMRWALAPLAIAGGLARGLARRLPTGAPNGLWRRLAAMVELAPPVTLAGMRQRVAPRDAGLGIGAPPGGAPHRVRAAALVRAREPGHRARAGRGRVPGGRARDPGMLRGAAAARRPHRAGPRAGPAQHRGVRAAGRGLHRRERRRLRLRDEGVRRALRTRPGVGRPRPSPGREGAGRVAGARGAGAVPGAPPPDRGTRRLPRRLSPGARPGRARRAASDAAGDSRASTS